MLLLGVISVQWNYRHFKFSSKFPTMKLNYLCNLEKNVKNYFNRQMAIIPLHSDSQGFRGYMVFLCVDN